jgi:hypothetical protein
MMNLRRKDAGQKLRNDVDELSAALNDIKNNMQKEERHMNAMILRLAITTLREMSYHISREGCEEDQ